MAVDTVTTAIKKVKVKASVQKVFGWIITIFNGLIAFVGLIQIGEVFDVVMVTFFSGITALGILLIKKGTRKTKLIKTFYDYSARLAADPEKSIDLLAASTGVTVALATKNITDMLAYGFFPNCYLDGQHNKMVVPTTQRSQSSTATTSISHGQTQTVKYTTVQCKGCGATNKIVVGTVGECEFCGSQLSE